MSPDKDNDRICNSALNWNVAWVSDKNDNERTRARMYFTMEEAFKNKLFTWKS